LTRNGGSDEQKRLLFIEQTTALFSNYEKNPMKSLLKREDRPTAVVYAMMLALIIIGCLVAIS